MGRKLMADLLFQSVFSANCLRNMQMTHTGHQLQDIVSHNLNDETNKWIAEKLDTIVAGTSARELYMAYTLLGSKIRGGDPVAYPEAGTDVCKYLEAHGASLLEICRIYLLVSVLEENPGYFKPKVAQLIQVADTTELVSFLRFLILLPDPEAFRHVGVEALRTNIATVFDAISQNNPYPSLFFDEQQWNQMYLKAAFMQRDLQKIQDIDKRANKELARIISDYAHERWAAGRDVDPYFWRPVSNFLEGVLLEDIKRLLGSEDPAENRAGALCCFHSSLEQANMLLANYAELKEQIAAGKLNWDTVKE
jgi:hypothetical protein